MNIVKATDKKKKKTSARSNACMPRFDSFGYKDRVHARELSFSWLKFNVSISPAAPQRDSIAMPYVATTCRIVSSRNQIAYLISGP